MITVGKTQREAVVTHPVGADLGSNGASVARPDAASAYPGRNLMATHASF